MWTYNMSDELYHHGIKGQKWGVRRTAEQLGYRSNKDVVKYAKAQASLQNEVSTSYALRAARAQGAKVSDDAQRMANTRTLCSANYVNKLAKQLSKKYDSIDEVIDYDDDTGYQYITAKLTDKLGNVYVSELYTGNYSVGDFILPKP